MMPHVCAGWHQPRQPRVLCWSCRTIACWLCQCCTAAGDQRSLFSAARAHSRLRKAAVVALRSITAQCTQQQQVDSVLQYLAKHAKHIDSVSLTGTARGGLRIYQLPPNLQLRSLQLECMSLQLQPGGCSHGVLGAASALTALKQLRLRRCYLGPGLAAAPTPPTLRQWFSHVDTVAAAALAAALAQLPAGLEYLSIDGLFRDSYSVQVPMAALQRLQQLTYLELAGVQLKGPDEASHTLQPLQALTRLVGLYLWPPKEVDSVPASVLSGAHNLTYLDLHSCSMDPGVLAGKTQLQHLQLLQVKMLGSAAGVAQALSHLQQLTHLFLTHDFHEVEDGNPLAAAFASLTASSMLRDLNIRFCTLPGDVWQHVFPAGRQLPQLQRLDIWDIKQLGGHAAPTPEGSRLVSCCPGLQQLNLQGVQLHTQLLAPLQGRSGLHTLILGARNAAAAEGLEAVCQLTRLRALDLAPPYDTEGLLPQLPQLKQLTRLRYCCGMTNVEMSSEGPDDEPVWRQLLRLHLDDSGPDAAKLSAAALAE